MDALPPREVEDKQALANGTAYFAAPDYHVLFESERSVALSRDQAVNFSRPSIDAAPESAALAYGAGAPGIVLSGASADADAAALALAGADAVPGIEQIAAGPARLGSPTNNTTGAGAR
ncbi:chemotaxis response regulator CheB [Janthinobacterium sp. CG_23.3]|uniref:chemotaxis protein CheB n=1 Tax=Janthinobacterium sp. CG_23.3 TaxID=3349634 RepID=UPI0038D44102